MDAYAALLERGISPDVIRHFGIRLTQRYGLAYWEYPVREVDGHIVSWRHKRAGEHRNAPKYGWSTEKLPARADAVYNLSVVMEGKLAIVAAGEPDVWLLAALRVRACSLLAGEGAVPASAVAALVARRPRRLLVLYDYDATGRRGAAALVVALRERGLDAVARVLPPEVGPKGDITDLYRLCDRDRGRFFAACRGLPCLEIPKREEAPTRHDQPRPASVHVPWGSSPIERLKATCPIADVIESAGVPLKPHAGGSYLTARCPFHDDHNPSFVVWPERGYFKCYGCGARGDVLDFMDRMRSLRAVRVTVPA